MEACIQRLAAGRGHGYRLAAPSLKRHWQWSSLLNVNDDQSAQRDKPLDGSRGETRSHLSILQSCSDALVFQHVSKQKTASLNTVQSYSTVVLVIECSSCGRNFGNAEFPIHGNANVICSTMLAGLFNTATFIF